MLAYGKLCAVAAGIDVLITQNAGVVLSALLVWLTDEVPEAVADAESPRPLFFERHPIDGQPIFVGPRYPDMRPVEDEPAARPGTGVSGTTTHEYESSPVEAVILVEDDVAVVEARLDDLL